MAHCAPTTKFQSQIRAGADAWLTNLESRLDRSLKAGKRGPKTQGENTGRKRKIYRHRNKERPRYILVGSDMGVTAWMRCMVMPPASRAL
jgi:hypothetical protein